MSPRQTFLTASEKEQNVVLQENSSTLSANRLLETLSFTGSIKSRNNLESLKLRISDYVKFLPGQLTPQKYLGLDRDSEINSLSYGRILEAVVEKFDNNWPLEGDTLDPLIERLMIIDGASLDLLSESLLILTSALKEAKDERKILTLSLLLEQLVKSDCVFSGMVNACRPQERSLIEEEELEQTWRNNVQVLISLPNRIANKLKQKVFDTFLPHVYTNIITYHLTRAISFVNTGLHVYSIVPKSKIFSSLLSKLTIVSSRTYLKELICILLDWSVENKNGIRNFIQDILKGLDISGIESIAILSLKHCNSNSEIQFFFGDLITDANWKYVLTTKIPLMSYSENEKLCINLILYLSSILSNNRILVELLQNLLDAWSDKSALTHTSIEQHKYITKLVILSASMSRNVLKPNEKSACQKLLFYGVSTHLESTDISIRAIGMITGEILTVALSEMDDAPKLKFEYASMPADIIKLVHDLKKLADVRNNDMQSSEQSNEIDLNVGNILFDSKGDKRIYKLGVACNILCPKSSSPADEVKSTIPETADVTKTYDHTAETVHEDENSENPESDSNLDSDDDLVPYDVSNDTNVINKSRPLYLRDLRDNLVNEKMVSNPDIFSATLNSCEELILQQLPNDDVSLGLELLEILTTVKESSYVENFELMTFNSCVTIVTICPKESAEYLCREFYADMGKYSISQRLFFLNILAESSRRLSSVVVKETAAPKNAEVQSLTRKPSTKKVSFFINTEETKKYEITYTNNFEEMEELDEPNMDWRDVIDRRIESKTKRFAHSAKMPKTVANKFGNVASSFFYPLLYGFERKGCYGLHKFADQGDILLIRFLKTLSTIMVAAQNTLLAPKMGKEILELLWTLRYHDEAKVRLAVIENVAAVLVAVPKDNLTNELLKSLLELRLWLLDLSEHVVGGDYDAECRSLGRKVLLLIDSVIGSATFGDM